MKRKIQLAFILLSIPLIFSVDHRYCTLSSCPNRTHTLCKYPKAGLGPSCRPAYMGSGLLPVDISGILNLYNNNSPIIKVYELRENSNAQDATNTGAIVRVCQEYLETDYLMEWDNELQYIAQRWANQCINKTDDCRHVARFHVRQRVDVTKRFFHDQEPSVVELVTRWYHEDRFLSTDTLDYQNLSLENIRSFESRYYTLVNRQHENRIGCGAIRTFDAAYQYLHLVCNFATTATIEE